MAEGEMSVTEKIASALSKGGLDALGDGQATSIEGLQPAASVLQASKFLDLKNFFQTKTVFISGRLIEIIRDFYQVSGVLFSFTVLPDALRKFIGNLAFCITLDWAIYLPDSEALTVGWWWFLFCLTLLLTSIMLFQWKKFTPSPRKDFLLVQTWGMLSEGMVNFLYATIFILTCLYQPLSQNALEILLCSYRWQPILQCPSSKGGWYAFSAVISLLAVTIALPVCIFILVKLNVPKVKEYDEEGRPMVYTVALYEEDLDKSKSPYTFLFCDYERRTAYFKVFIMLMKLYLVIVSVCLSSNRIIGYHYAENTTMAVNVTGALNWTYISIPSATIIPDAESHAIVHVKGILLILGLIGYAVFMSMKRPFIDNLSDNLDGILRIAAATTAICTYLIVLDAGKTAFTVICIIAQSIALVCSLMFLLYSNTTIRKKVRQMRGRVVLSTVPKELARGDPKEPLLFSEFVDFKRERKRRIWHFFWDSLFAEHEDFKPPSNQTFDYADTEDTTAYLLDFKGTVGERHIENKEIASDIGWENFRLGLKAGTNEELQAMVYTFRFLHGRDIYHGPLDDPDFNGFGACYVLPFPFEAFFIQDETNKEVRITQCNVEEFVRVNCHPEVLRRRKVRDSLRALHMMGVDAEGNSIPIADFNYRQSKEIEIDKIKYNVNITFSKGTFTVEQDYASPTFTPSGMVGNESATRNMTIKVTPGFRCKMKYTSGQYDHPTIGTSVTHNETIEIEDMELGITPTLQPTEALGRLLQGNGHIISQGLPYVADTRDYLRLHFMQEFLDKQQTLSYAFWPVVYDNQHLPKEDLLKFLSSYEQNALVRKLADPMGNRNWIELLFTRLSYYDAHPAVSLWVCFWHDVWTHNADVTCIEENEEAKQFLNPSYPQSVSWTMCGEEHLNKQLQNLKLQEAAMGKGFIQQTLIHRLYEALENVSNVASKVKSVSPITTADEEKEGERGTVDDKHEPLFVHDLFEMMQSDLFKQSLHHLTDKHPDMAWMYGYLEEMGRKAPTV